MILLWGLMEDSTFRSVYECLKQCNADVTFVNHASIRHTRIEFRSHPEPSYLLQCDDLTCALDNVSSAYLRPYDHKLYDGAAGTVAAPNSIQSPDFVHHLLMNWAEHSPAMIVNRPSAEATNQSKPYQSTFIKASAFRVPDSLISNDRSQILQFCAQHREVIYKSISSVRSVVKLLDFSAMDEIGEMGPVFFQQRVMGRNVRVHVIGDQTVACAIDSEGTDYRYAPSQIEPFDLPDDIAKRCVALSRRLGLVLAGIDLIRTPQGEYYCLEANPSPAFSCFEIAPNPLIAQLVAERLLIADGANFA